MDLSQSQKIATLFKSGSAWELVEYESRRWLDQLLLDAKDEDAPQEIRDNAAAVRTPILHDLEPERSSLIIARSGLLGEAEAFREVYNREAIGDEFDKLATAFLASVFGYFEEVHLTVAERYDLLESGDLYPGSGGERFRRVLPRNLCELLGSLASSRQRPVNPWTIR